MTSVAAARIANARKAMSFGMRKASAPRRSMTIGVRTMLRSEIAMSARSLRVRR